MLKSLLMPHTLALLLMRRLLIVSTCKTGRQSMLAVADIEVGHTVESQLTGWNKNSSAMPVFPYVHRDNVITVTMQQDLFPISLNLSVHNIHEKKKRNGLIAHLKHQRQRYEQRQTLWTFPLWGTLRLDGVVTVECN